MRPFLVIVLVMLTLCAPRRVSAQPETINGIAAIVNEAVITYYQVTNFTGQTLEALRMQYWNQPEVYQQKRMQIVSDALEQLVERRLILHEFKDSGAVIPEGFIDDQIKDQIRERYGDRVTLIKTLQGEGITMEAYRQRIRDDLVVEYMRQKHISSALLISPEKIQTYYETNRTEYQVADQVKLRMIVINRPPAASSSHLRELANEILRKIDEGAPFEEMANIYSDQTKKNSGGDWYEKSGLRNELAEVAFKLEPGQHSGVIETPGAFFLVKVEEKRTAHVRPLQEVRDDIEKILLLQERSRLQKKWLDRLRKKSFVRYF